MSPLSQLRPWKLQSAAGAPGEPQPLQTATLECGTVPGTTGGGWSLSPARSAVAPPRAARGVPRRGAAARGGAARAAAAAARGLAAAVARAVRAVPRPARERQHRAAAQRLPGLFCRPDTHQQSGKNRAGKIVIPSCTRLRSHGQNSPIQTYREGCRRSDPFPAAGREAARRVRQGRDSSGGRWRLSG